MKFAADVRGGKDKTIRLDSLQIGKRRKEE